MNSKVEKRHKLFAQEYVIDFNTRRAAIAAGYGEARAGVSKEISRTTFKPPVCCSNH